ncbi:unnamed protein product, partial [Prorocentrum cordatum]
RKRDGWAWVGHLEGELEKHKGRAKACRRTAPLTPPTARRASGAGSAARVRARKDRGGVRASRPGWQGAECAAPAAKRSAARTPPRGPGGPRRRRAQHQGARDGGD